MAAARSQPSPSAPTPPRLPDPTRDKAKSFGSVISGDTANNFFPKPLTYHNGEVSIECTDEEIEIFSQSLKLTLIGKFTDKRPPMQAMCSAFARFSFKEEVDIGLIDNKLVLLRFKCKEDYM